MVDFGDPFDKLRTCALLQFSGSFGFERLLSKIQADTPLRRHKLLDFSRWDIEGLGVAIWSLRG